MTQLVRYEAARHALAEAHSIDEVRDIRDKAEAMRAYAKQAKDEEFQRWAAEIKLRAERKAGLILEGMKTNGERLAGRPEKESQAATLSDLGVTNDESSRWQQAAKLDDEEFEAFVANKPADGLTSAAVRRAANEKEREIAREQSKAIPLPKGKFDVIVIDPAWPMEKIISEARPNQVGFDYPTMSLDEISAFGVPDLAANDSHLFCWTTQKFLPATFGILQDWGFKYVFTMVWHKPGGFQPFNMPQYNCEFVVYGRRGAPRFADTKAFNCCESWPRKEHSRKPDEFYDLVRRVTEGRRIDVFSRERRQGFSQFGNETEKFI